jgi:hypothetical protein
VNRRRVSLRRAMAKSVMGAFAETWALRPPQRVLLGRIEPSALGDHCESWTADSVRLACNSQSVLRNEHRSANAVSRSARHCRSSDRRARHTQNNAARVAGLGRILLMSGKSSRRLYVLNELKHSRQRLTFAFHSPILRLNAWVRGIHFRHATGQPEELDLFFDFRRDYFIFTNSSSVVSRSGSPESF